MIPPQGDPSNWLFFSAGSVLGLALIFCLYRLVRGPTLPDRVVALDLIGFIVVGVLCTFAIVTQRPPLLAVSLVAALILFLGTAAFAIFLERRAAR